MGQNQVSFVEVSSLQRIPFGGFLISVHLKTSTPNEFPSLPTSLLPPIFPVILGRSNAAVYNSGWFPRRGAAKLSLHAPRLCHRTTGSLPLSQSARVHACRATQGHRAVPGMAEWEREIESSKQRCRSR